MKYYGISYQSKIFSYYGMKNRIQNRGVVILMFRYASIIAFKLIFLQTKKNRQLFHGKIYDKKYTCFKWTKAFFGQICRVATLSAL